MKHTCATEPWHRHIEGLDVISASKNLPKLHMSNYTYKTPRSAVKPGIEKLNGVLISQDPTNLHEKLPMMGLSRQIYSRNLFPMMTNFWNHSFLPLEGLDPSLQKNRSPSPNAPELMMLKMMTRMPLRGSAEIIPDE